MVDPVHKGNFLWEVLERHGDAPAVIEGARSVGFTELALMADTAAQDLRALLPEKVARPLVLIEATPTLKFLAAYLGCLRAGWPVILTAAGQGRAGSALVEEFTPNVVCLADAPAEAVNTRNVPMHPELAVLLSTSGTTGATKLVRLSRTNLQANAEAIAEYLGLSARDATITTLPLHYSYGMSVLHTHLLVGGRIALTEEGLVDPGFWQTARAVGANSLALVPTQFELLEKVGFSEEMLPDLRYMTQAGGRIDPLLARRFAQRAKNGGWLLFIMYGQTEAGPRMSYLPPEDALEHAETIGRPIRGGEFRIVGPNGEDITEAGVPGELVYTGPNVMLGYARTARELADPAGPDSLPTGDIAQREASGYYRIVGRASRFVKLFGLRVGLDEIEASLRKAGHRAYVAGTDTGVVVFVTEETGDTDALRLEVADRYGLPSRLFRVTTLYEVPTLSSGKVDYRTLGQLAEIKLAGMPTVPETAGGGDLYEFLKTTLRRREINPDKSFRELGADSLAYLETELYLSGVMGSVPADWDQMPLSHVDEQIRGQSGTAVPARWVPVQSDLLLRITAILAVLTLHGTDLSVRGGSFLLLILAGFSLARFQRTALFEGRIGSVLESMLLPVLVAYYALVLLLSLKFGPLAWPWFTLTVNLFEPLQPRFMMPYWYVSTYAQIIVLASLPFLFTPVRRAVARAPFGTSVAVLLALAVALVLTGVVDIRYSLRHHHPAAALVLLVWGWVLACADTPLRKALASLAVLAVFVLCWSDVDRSVAVFLLGGSVALLWLSSIPMPRPIQRGALLVGTLTLYIYLLHIPVLYVARPYFDAQAATLAVTFFGSLAAAYVAKRLYDGFRSVLGRYRHQLSEGAAPPGTRSSSKPDRW
ncbi:AMP-binding protein [Palleronia sp. KMU-117]|uniref:AMP-binding protein n=1 Tax=Palleronia sp. KMU-117 TaxID=3434108 RepID=UPI003D710A08